MPRKAPAKVEPIFVDKEAPIFVTNTVRGRTLHLGDGRKLAYGESAEVTPELAALLA